MVIVWKNAMKPRPSFRNQHAARTAFEILVREHRHGVLAYARSLVDDSGTAEDLAQEAFLVAWRKLDKFDPEKDFGAWIRGMVRYEYLHWVRKRKLIPLDDEILDRVEQFHSDLAGAVDCRESVFEAVRQCVATLPSSLRNTIEAVYNTGLTCPEIAKREDASDSAIRKRLQRGRDLVADCLAEKISIPSLSISP